VSQQDTTFEKFCDIVLKKILGVEEMGIKNFITKKITETATKKAKEILSDEKNIEKV